MIKKEFKKETLATLDIMIANAERGPSGFWVDDFEGCGNPYIFPEFEDGLKKGKLVQKKHYLCPWNTAVLFGEGHGNIHTGCYHSCSISEAKYLPAKMLKDVLLKFKQNMNLGVYDNPTHLKPLLTQEELSYIRRQKEVEKNKKEQQERIEQENKIRKSKKLVEKFKNNKDIQKLIIGHYGDNEIVMSEFGTIDFSPNSIKEIVSSINLTYDDYLEAQFNSKGNYRHDFANCYYNIPMGFMGQIEKTTKDKVCFKRIFVSGMFPDGVMFDGKEEHVWMNKQGFEGFSVDDSVSFFAEIYRYIKTGNGKTLDFGLRNPQSIRKIDAYKLPTDEELMMQQINWIICESCMLKEQCNKNYCIMNPKDKKRLKKQLLTTAKESGKNTEVLYKEKDDVL